MAILDPLHPVQSAIIETLMHKRALTASQIHDILVEKYSLKVSVANLYRVIALLVEKQVLTRVGTELGLNLVWLTHLIKFAALAREEYFLSNDTVIELPRNDGEQKIYSEDSLIALDPIWNDLLIVFGNKKVSDSIWGFNSHPWYFLASGATEQRLYQGLVSHGISVQMLIGDDSFLDEFGCRMIAQDSLKVGCRSRKRLPLLLQSDDLIYWVAGPYVAECRLPRSLSSLFSFFFSSVQSPEEFDIDAFSDLFRVKAKCSIVVTNSVKKAREVQSCIEEALTV
jgi:hypothetical protein